MLSNDNVVKLLLDQKQITRLIYQISLRILDLYTMMRMFKVNDNPSHLTICYLGNDHALSISTILIYFFGYQPKFYKNQLSNRCIVIDKPISIDEDIVKSIEDHSAFKEETSLKFGRKLRKSIKNSRKYRKSVKKSRKLRKSVKKSRKYRKSVKK
jgi:hypothetical protein